MKISIVIPTYEGNGRGKEFLSNCIQSIYAQTYDNYEIIVTDHSVDDEIELMVQNFDKVYYVRNENDRGNSSANMNFGTLFATGDIVKPMFYDDFFFSNDALEKIHERFVMGAVWVAVGSNCSADRNTFSHQLIPYYNDEIIYGKNTMSSPSCIAYTRRCGVWWDERLLWLMDCKFYREMHDKYGDPWIIRDVLVTNYAHPGQMTNSLSDERKGWEVYEMRREYGTH